MLPSKLAGLTGWRVYGLGALSGASLALGHPPFNIPWFLFLAVPLLFTLLKGRSVRSAFGLGWVAGLAYFAVALHWIVEPFLVDLARTGWMAPFALVLLSAGLALFWAVPFAVFARWGGGALGFAALWTIGEFARATVLTGFPWALLAYAWVETPIAQAAAFLGPHGLGLLLVVLAVLPAVLQRVGIAAVVIFGLAGWFGLSQRINTDIPMTQTSVRLVQPNAPQHLKWHPDHYQTFWDRQLKATAAAGEVDVIVWPETAVPYLLGTRTDLNAAISAKAGDVPVVLGAMREDADAWRNSAAVLGPGGEITALYDKHHLVPFGEFMPLRGLADRLGLQGLTKHAGRFASGEGPATLEISGLPVFQPLICYEAIFPAEILRGARRPSWLLQLTNDAWFGDFSGPYQHLAQARMRAIEFGLPFARSANTGVSAMIDPYGRIVAQIALNTEGHVDVALPAANPPTLYSFLGNRVVLTLIFVLLAFGVTWERLYTQNSKENLY